MPNLIDMVKKNASGKSLVINLYYLSYKYVYIKMYLTRHFQQYCLNEENILKNSLKIQLELC